MKKLVVIGSSNMDLVVSTEHFPLPGQTVLGNKFMTNFGGKGANQAVAASLLGSDVTFICKVGNDDYGRAMIEKFRKDGIDTRHVSTTDQAATGIAIITVDAKGENTIVVASGANSMLTSEDIINAESAISAADVLLMQLETPVEPLRTAARMAHEMGKYVILNPAPAPKKPLLSDLLKHIDLIIPNETEATSITGVEISDLQSAELAMEALKGMGVKDAMITLGEKGVLAYEDGKAKLFPTCKVQAIDTTAAGDTFCGALSVAICQGKGKKEAIAFANKAAAYTVQHEGAQCAMPHLNDL
ncbi:MAG: ribokinase [Muribaculaceae bacterium]|nr:ribokinase [Muribaculaceae bacterium]